MTKGDIESSANVDLAQDYKNIECDVYFSPFAAVLNIMFRLVLLGIHVYNAVGFCVQASHWRTLAKLNALWGIMCVRRVLWGRVKKEVDCHSNNF